MIKKRFKIIPVASLLLIKNNQVLLARRLNTGFMDGKYGLVAGHMEKNEGFTNAIIREAKEEANIILKPENLGVVYVLNRFEPPEDRNDPELRERVDVFFSAEKWQGEIRNLEPKKCDDLSWFPMNKLPKNIIPYIKLVIDNIKKGKFYSEFGYKK